MPDRAKTRAWLERQALDHRERAEEFRTVGENTINRAAREALLKLAGDYDALAAQIEDRAAALGRPEQP